MPTAVHDGDGQVSRDVGDRSWTVAADPTTALRWEVLAAAELGWELVAVRCEGADAFAQLTRGSSPDDGVLATVAVAKGGGAGAGAGARTVVTVGGQAAHHADGSWPDWPGTDPASTCLEDGSEGSAERVGLPAEPLEGDAAQPDAEGFDGWESDEPTAQEQALLEAVGTRLEKLAAVSGQPVDLAYEDLAKGDTLRTGALASGTLSTDDRPAQHAMNGLLTMTAPGDLVWTACTPGKDRSIDARVRVATDEGAATVRYLIDATGATTWTVRVAPPGTPALAHLEAAEPLGQPTCLADQVAVNRVTTAGTPVAVPDALHPVAPAG